MPPNWKSVSVGDWELLGILGQGGFGEVHHWKNRKTDQEVATKRIKNAENMSVDQQRKLRQRWKEEYEWTQQLQNPKSIVAGVKLSADSQAFIDYLNKNHFCQLPVIILEYCNGGDVRKLLQKSQNANGLLEFEVRQILGSLRQAVDFLHTHCKLCHRDLKPDNIVIHRLADGRRLYKLTDFGLSRESPDKTILQSVVGTRHYYAPEVVETGKYNNKVDYWSMGIIAYELVTGVQPYIPHQSVVNIHQNLQKKPWNCIAITEDYVTPLRFHFHTEIPIGHHLSVPWLAQFTKWLPLALNFDYSRRGSPAATDEVQDASAAPVIFTEIDRLLEMKVLTIFAACAYKRLEYEVTSSMTMQQLFMFIEESIGLPSSSIYLVLPLGHPHKRLTRQTKPVDLFVDDWCDNSEGSRNPPVMLYVFNVTEKCPYVKPVPYMPPALKHYLSAEYKKLENWLVDRLMLDMHHVLHTEQAHVRMLVCGFKDYALSLEHEVLEYQILIKTLDKEKYKCCGAIEHFQVLLSAAEEQQKLHLNYDDEWKSNWMKLAIKHKEIVTSIEKIVHHYESILNNVRTDCIKKSQEMYDNTIESDIFNIKDYQKKYLYSCPTWSELSDISINFAKSRYAFLENKEMKNLRESTNQTHLRFSKIPIVVNNAHENLRAVQAQLLHLQLQMLASANPIQQVPIFDLNNAMSQLSFGVANGVIPHSLDAFDSLSTENVIAQALYTRQLLESGMEIDQTVQH
ncbi:inhibitor of nuclear factor kappa-B kinase subunit beta [Drosophila grimshawi]|uniref:IkappaB kinase n=1 Tax=Drosophila grimshawi TaxID=7222 RepID=B4JGA4_DROGR|nr:inhibitor of nuclear factor kappa-B kinase subunit beta [Drosophila grimshawi]EDV92573.1 GH18841 [Drosophila grimshawi]